MRTAPETLLTPIEAAALLRLSPWYVRWLLREGRLRGVRPGGRGQWRIPLVSVERYLSGREPEAPAPKGRRGARAKKAAVKTAEGRKAAGKKKGSR